jgi:hypothetical protein
MITKELLSKVVEIGPLIENDALLNYYLKSNNYTIKYLFLNKILGMESYLMNFIS